MDLKWTQRALADLGRILDYIAQDNPAAASSLARTVRQTTEHLREHPYLGRVSTGDCRELVLHRHYLLTYRIKPGRVEILQVWHTAQDR